MFRFRFLSLGLIVAVFGCDERRNPPGGTVTVQHSHTSTLSVSVQPSPPVGPPAPAGTPPGPYVPPLPIRQIIQMNFVEIPSGDFLRGAPLTEPGFSPSEQQRLAVIPQTFWLAQTELTQEQFQRVTGKNPSLTKGLQLPVTCVAWEDVQEFLNLANAQSPDFLLRLPTEQEWEYACRARSSLPFAPPEDKTLELQTALQKHDAGDPEFLFRFVGRFAWYRQSQPQPVAQLASNAWGIFDMHGNVWEWCEGDDPDSDLRPLRGGAWSTTDVFGCRAAMRAWEPKDTCKDSIGFRLLAEPRQ